MTLRIKNTDEGSSKLELSLGTIGQIILVLTTIVSVTWAFAQRPTTLDVKEMIRQNNELLIEKQQSMKNEIILGVREILETRDNQARTNAAPERK